MGATQSTPQTPKQFKAAGCFFTNGIHVLGGLQKKKGQWIVSGLGGGREGNEILPVTALREVFEELLGLFELNPALLHDLYLKHTPTRALFSEEYVNYVYTFQQLESILQIIYNSGITSCPLYTQFPLTIQDLIFKRSVNTSEVTLLTLLPAQPCILADEFQKDIQQALDKQHKQSL